MTEVIIDQRAVSAEEDSRRRARFPRGAAVSFSDLEDAGREDVLDDLREHEPISWVPALSGWLATSREAARQVLALRAPTSVAAKQNLVRASLGRMMLTVDGEEHARLRKPLETHFRPNTLEDRFAADIRYLVDELLDEFGSHPSADFGAGFAAPFAVRMAGRALGLALTDVSRIDGFYTAFAEGMVYDGNPARQRRADTARTELNELLHAELERHRATAGPSITAALAADSNGLTDSEIVAQLRVVMFGAIETIQASVMTTLLLLLLHPDQLRLVQNEPALLPAAGEEARRLIPPVAFVERWTRDLTSVGGVDIPASEFVGVSILAANRDPATFDRPLDFDVRRSNANKALSFSFGVHACLGLHLARLQTTIAVGRTLERLKGLELESYEPAGGFAFRRPGAMHLSWSGQPGRGSGEA